MVQDKIILCGMTMACIVPETVLIMQDQELR